MQDTFLLSCESTVDVPYRCAEQRNLRVIFYSYTINGELFEDDMGRNPSAMPLFYELLENGALPHTSQISKDAYLNYFRDLLWEGDVLHIAFGSGMTASVNNAQAAAEELRAEFPERRITVIDSLCSSSGYGLLVDGAADLRDAGKTMDEVADWVLAWRQRVHHQFFSTDLKHYRRSGRMSGPAAMAGTLLSICPIMRLDDKGCIIAYDKVRGKKAAIQRTADEMALHAVGGELYSGKCWISHSNCPERAEQMRDTLRARFPDIDGEIRVFDIGSIIAAHCGPGTVAIYFFGDIRPDLSAKEAQA